MPTQSRPQTNLGNANIIAAITWITHQSSERDHKTYTMMYCSYAVPSMSDQDVLHVAPNVSLIYWAMVHMSSQRY